MNYTILEVHQVYEHDKLKELAVLWQDRRYVRATSCTSTPCGGYKFLMPNEEISQDLIQEVAGQGIYLSDTKKKKYFPGKRNWSR